LLARVKRLPPRLPGGGREGGGRPRVAPHGQLKDRLSAIALSPEERLLAATDIAGLAHIWAVGS